MPLEHRIDRALLALLAHTLALRPLPPAVMMEQDIPLFIRPIEREGGGVGDEPVVEGYGRVEFHHAIAHARPGQMVDPGRVRDEDLARARGDPIGEAFVVFLRGGDLPAHDEEHDVEHRDLFREVGEVRELAEDVGEEFGERVGEGCAFGVEEGGDGGVGRADCFRGR